VLTYIDDYRIMSTGSSRTLTVALTLRTVLLTYEYEWDFT